MKTRLLIVLVVAALWINPAFGEPASGRATPEQVQASKQAEADIAKLTKALAQSPSDTNLWLKRGLAWKKVIRKGTFWDEMGDGKAARADLDKAIELDPKLTDAYIARAGLVVDGVTPADQSSTELYAAAMKDLAKAIELEPRRAEAYAQRASLTRAMMRGDADTAAMLGEQMLAAFDQQIRRTLEDADRAVQLDEKLHKPMRELIGTMARERFDARVQAGEHTIAAPMAEPLARLYPEDMALLRSAADTLMRVRAGQNALRLLDRQVAWAAALPVDAPMAQRVGPLVLRGQILTAAKQFDRAVADFDAAEKIGPKEMNIYQSRAMCLARQNRLDEALAESNRGFVNAKPTAEAYAARGDLQMYRRDLAAAILDYNEAVQLEPKNPQHWQRTMTAFEHLGKHQQAAFAAGEALGVSKGLNLPLRLHHAMLLTIAGDAAQAKANYEKYAGLSNRATIEAHLPALDAALAKFPHNRDLADCRATLGKLLEEKKKAEPTTVPAK